MNLENKWTRIFAFALVVSVTGVFFFSRKTEKEASLEPNRGARDTASAGKSAPLSTLAPNTPKTDSKRVPASRPKTLEEIKEALQLLSDPDKKITVDLSDKNQIRTVFGTFPAAIESEGSALELARRFADIISIPQAQVSPVSLPVPANPRITSFIFEQKIGRYKVFNSYVKVVGQNKDKSGFQISNELKAVQLPNEEPVLRLSYEDAKKILLELHPQANFHLEGEKSPPQEPVIYADETPHEWAWEFVYKIRYNDKKITTYRSLISTVSGKERYFFPVSVN